MAPLSRTEKVFDIAIVGTGLYGIQAARYFLDIHPEANLILLESDTVIGGTWSKKRVYDDFWTQTPVHMAEFSDRPMILPPSEDNYWGFFPAKHTTAYLESYIDNHVYNGQTIRDRVHFEATVNRISKSSNGTWEIFYGDHCILAKKLIDATGMTSKPNIPTIQNSESFQGLAIHHKDFAQSEFLSDMSKQHVVVIGGAKSAADVAYASAKAGKTVSWIIREGGNGPAALFAPQSMSKRYTNSNEGFYNRFMANFLPNPFGSKSVLSTILHGTWFGRIYLRRLWEGFDAGLRGLMNYQREDGKEMGFSNLEPDTPIFWQNDSSGVDTRPDLLSTIASKVHVCRQSIDALGTHSITLNPKSGSRDEHTTIKADVLVFCTGWSATSSIFSSRQAISYGLSTPVAEVDPDVQAEWKALEDAADPKVLSKFPSLAVPPKYHKIEAVNTPFRLFNAMVPPIDAKEHSLVFLGKLVVGNNFRIAEVQALWAVAYLDGHIKTSPSVMKQNIAMTVAWDRRRYLNKGNLGAWYYFDVVAYADMLLEQLGLSSHLQKGWFANMMEPCFAGDLKNLVAEYKKKYGL